MATHSLREAEQVLRIAEDRYNRYTQGLEMLIVLSKHKDGRDSQLLLDIMQKRRELDQLHEEIVKLQKDVWDWEDAYADSRD
jgi:hypothetical protein